MTHIGEARWQQYVLDECDAETVLLIEAHLSGCALCRQRLAEERRLDEWLLETIPAAGAGSAERSLERLWAAVDAGAHPGGAPVPWKRRVALWWPALAAASALALVWSLDDSFTTAPLLETSETTAVAPDRAAVPAPLGVDAAELNGRGESVGRSVERDGLAAEAADAAEAVDAGRLRTAQQRTASVLLDAQQRMPDDDDEFGGACAAGLAGLRAEGWPVGSLVRSWALGDDLEVAAVALRYAACEPSTSHVLAAALDRGERRAELALAQLERDVTPVEGSLALVRALERRAIHEDNPARIASLLARSQGPRSGAALSRLLDDRVDQAIADPSSALAGEALLQLATLVPVSEALDALLTVSVRQALEPTMRSAFLARLDSAEAEAVAALSQALGQRNPPPVLLDWIVASERPALVPALLSNLEDEPTDERFLAAVVSLGGEQAASGLIELWSAETGSGRAPLLSGVNDILRREPQTLERIGLAYADRGSEEAQELSQALAPELASPLLLACLVAQENVADDDGHRAALLLALARRGPSGHGARLLEWIGTRPADDQLLPLAWAVASQLDSAATGEAWVALGHDPSRLHQVAGSTARRFAASSLPSERMLTPLRRALSAHAR